MRMNKKPLLMVLVACASLLLIGVGRQAASEAQQENFADMFTVDFNGSPEFANQVLEVEDKYRIEIRDESGDLRPDHWELYIDGVLRCKRWSPLGYGPPSRGEIYDSDGKLAVKIVTKY